MKLEEISTNEEDIFEGEPQLGNERVVIAPKVVMRKVKFNRKLYWKKKKSQRK